MTHEHAYEVQAIGSRVELLLAARHVALVERDDGRCFVPPVGTLSRSITEGADLFALMAALDRAPVKGDVLMSVADIDAELARLNARLRELR